MADDSASPLVGKTVLVKRHGLVSKIVSKDPGGHLNLEGCETKPRASDLIFLLNGLTEEGREELHAHFVKNNRKMPLFARVTFEEKGDDGTWAETEESVLDEIQLSRVVMRQPKTGSKTVKPHCIGCGGEVPEGSMAVDPAEDEGEDEDEDSTLGRKRKAVDEDDLEGEGGARKRRPGRVSLEKGDVDDEDDDGNAGEVAGEDMGTLMAALLANVKAYKARLESGGELSEEEVDEKVAERCRTSMRLLAEQHHEIMLPSFLRLLKEYREKEIDPPSAELAVAVVEIRKFKASREKMLKLAEDMPEKDSDDVAYEDGLKAKIKRKEEEQKSKIGEMKELELNLEEKAKELYDEGKRQYAVSHVPTPEKSKRRLSEILSEQSGAASEE